jgi:hypothetical protein
MTRMSLLLCRHASRLVHIYANEGGAGLCHQLLILLGLQHVLHDFSHITQRKRFA